MWAEPIVYIGPGVSSDYQVECKVRSVVIHHGRDDPGSQPLASTATLELYGPLPLEAVLGARVEFAARMTGPGQYTRFVGEVTDRFVRWETVDIAVPTIIATGVLGRIGRRIVGDTPWTAELDGDRVNRILALAGYSPNPLYTDRGTVTVLPRDVDRQPALTLAHEAAEDGGGIVWSPVAGTVLYADATHRRGAPVAFEFQACDMGLGLTWEQTPEGLVNDLWLAYGATPDGGDQPQVHASHAQSILDRGTYGESVATRIQGVGDAQKRADGTVARSAVPAWILEGLEINLELLNESETNALFALDVHSLVSVTGLPEGSPLTSALLWVEGWRETVEATESGLVSWRVEFATADYCRTGAAPLWDDMDPATTWATIDPTMTWDDSVCMPPAPSSGRWNDVPASLRWDRITPSSTTWDEWPY